MAVRKIIHISDLHFSHDNETLSLLQKDNFVEDFIRSLKDIDAIDTLIISGDIVDRGGSQRAYKQASLFIDKLRNELNIKHILCIPGNHDVNRKLLEGISGDDDVDIDKLWEKYDVKLKYYWEFIDKTNLCYYQNSGLVSYEILQNPNMILLGIDSTDRIGTSDGCGFVNVEKLSQALSDILGKNEKIYKEYTKVAVLHHRPIIYESSSQTITENNGSDIGQYGTCNAENWKKVREILLAYDVHYVLTGHVHGSQSGQIRPFDSPHDEINYSTVGSIGVDFSRELKVRLNNDSDKILLDKLDKLICYGSLNGNHNAYNIWTFDDDGLIQEDQYKYIVDEGIRNWCHWKTKEFEKTKEALLDSEGVFDTEVSTVSVRKEESENYEERILECVRDHDLYKTGHYHWKNTARINWIDTSYFFQHREMMFYIARGIDELFAKEQVLRKADCIIGLGIKGSILLSYVRFLFPQMKCSYLPENEKEYNRYEMALFEGNEEIKSIVVLTDVVHSGETIKQFSENVYNKVGRFLNVNVVTIFDATPNGKIAKVKDKARITLFALAKLKVIDCQGGGENCDIYIRKLANIIEYKED